MNFRPGDGGRAANRDPGRGLLIFPNPDLTVNATGASGASVVFSSSITASDAVDGTVPVSSPSTSGLKYGDTFPLGQTTVNCSATDAAGNNAQASFTVKVLYDFGSGSGGGFSPPVSGSVLNTVKAGQGVPVKFGLGATSVWTPSTLATRYPGKLAATQGFRQIL